ncbi:MAG: hypothetical protein WB767_12975 [Nocardioides sp.]
MSASADRAPLRPLLEAVLREEAGVVELGRLCPRCGSAEHGQPHARTRHGAPLHVSLGYATGLGVVAWSRSAPVGIDVELDGAPVDGVGARTDWTRHEALAKATGLGLVAEAELADLATWPLALPAGYVGTVAGSGVSWRWVALEARSDEASR